VHQGLTLSASSSFLPANFFFCVFTGGRVLFAGTDTGCIRAYKYPLNGEFQEFRCCGSAITQLMLTYDDAVLFASGQDGSLFVFDVKDKDPTRVVTKRYVHNNNNNNNNINNNNHNNNNHNNNKAFLLMMR